MTDRQTDRPTNQATRSVTIGRIYVHSTAMQPNNNNLTYNMHTVEEILNPSQYVLCFK